MRRRIALGVLMLALAVAVGACVRQATPPEIPPDPATQLGVGVPVLVPETLEAQRIAALLPPRVDPDFETTMLAGFAEVRPLFAGVMLPRETLGRRLIRIEYGHANVHNVDPKQTLALIYEDDLTVCLARHEWDDGPPEMPNPTSESTEVAGVSGKAELMALWEGVPLQWAEVSWRAGQLRWSVSGAGLTKAEVVKIARSLAP